MPVGPGLNASDNRDRASQAVPLPGFGKLSEPDLDAYGGDSRAATGVKSPNRSTRTGNNRVAVMLPSGGLKVPPGPRAPVFF